MTPNTRSMQAVRFAGESGSGRRRTEAPGRVLLGVDVVEDLFVAVTELGPHREIGAADLVELERQVVAVLCRRPTVDLGLQPGFVVLPRHVFRRAAITRTGDEDERRTSCCERPNNPPHRVGTYRPDAGPPCVRRLGSRRYV